MNVMTVTICHDEYPLAAVAGMREWSPIVEREMIHISSRISGPGSSTWN
jgi:hypothetical protein